MAATGKATTKFLHCLPAVHNRDTILGEQLYAEHGLDGAEVTNSVFTSPASLVFDQLQTICTPSRPSWSTPLASERRPMVATGGNAPLQQRGET